MKHHHHHLHRHHHHHWPIIWSIIITFSSSFLEVTLNQREESSLPSSWSTSSILIFRQLAIIIISNQVDVEVSVRADKEALDGDQIPLQFIVRFVQDDGVTGIRDFSTDVCFKDSKPMKNYKQNWEPWQMIMTKICFWENSKQKQEKWLKLQVLLTVRELTAENDPTSEYTKEQEEADRW